MTQPRTNQERRLRASPFDRSPYRCAILLRFRRRKKGLCFPKSRTCWQWML